VPKAAPAPAPAPKAANVEGEVAPKLMTSPTAARLRRQENRLQMQTRERLNKYARVAADRADGLFINEDHYRIIR
jgi:hypothetical protein